MKVIIGRELVLLYMAVYFQVGIKMQCKQMWTFSRFGKKLYLAQ